MTLEQLLRDAWNNGMGSYRNTKTSKQLKIEEDDYIDGMEHELKLFSLPDVSITEGKLCEICECNNATIITEHCQTCDEYIINIEHN